MVRLVADGSDPLETRTDARGRFDLGAQAGREVAIGAVAGDALGAIRHLDLRDPTSPTDIELALIACPVWISGRVTDAGGGTIPHARVLREDVIGTETDASGAYQLCTLPTAALVSQLDVVVRADGYGTVVAGVAPAGRSVRDFMLAPEATIAGTASPGAAIWIESDRDEATRTGERSPRQTMIADADGRFRFTGVSGGRYRVGGAATGAIAHSTLVSVAPSGVVEVALKMRPAATVHGRLTVHGVPLAGARIALRRETVVMRHDDPAKDLVGLATATTQPDGTFVLDGISPGPTTLAAVPVRVVSAPQTLIAAITSSSSLASGSAGSAALSDDTAHRCHSPASTSVASVSAAASWPMPPAATTSMVSSPAPTASSPTMPGVALTSREATASGSSGTRRAIAISCWLGVAGSKEGSSARRASRSRT